MSQPPCFEVKKSGIMDFRLNETVQNTAAVSKNKGSGDFQVVFVTI